MIFRRKSEKEKLRRATLRGFKIAKKRMYEQFNSELKTLKAYYAAKLKEKQGEIKKLDLMVKKIQRRAQWLDEFEGILYVLYKKATKNSYVDYEEMARKFKMLDEAVGEIEIKQITHNKKKQKIIDLIDEYEVEKLKMVK